MAATYLTLSQCRDQVNIKDATFTEDDSYLQWLAEAAELSVQRKLDRDLSELEDDDGDLDKDLHLAILFLVAQWYKHRENTIVGTIVSPMPFSMNDILETWMKHTTA